MVEQVSDPLGGIAPQIATAPSPFFVTTASGAPLPQPIPVQASAGLAVGSEGQRASTAESSKRRRVEENHPLPDSARLIAARDSLFQAQCALQRLNHALIMSVTSASFTNTGRLALESALAKTERLSKVLSVTEIHDWLNERIHVCRFLINKNSIHFL